jgi:hypothetical protein
MPNDDILSDPLKEFLRIRPGNAKVYLDQSKWNGDETNFKMKAITGFNTPVYKPVKLMIDCKV